MSDVVEVIFFTDPYCTWCWGSEPQMRRLQVEFGDQIQWRTVLGGMVEDINQVGDPATVEAMFRWVIGHKLEASRRHGMPFHPVRFSEGGESFRSTWPASMAVKAVGHQKPEAEAPYLRAVREAIELEGRNMNDFDELAAVARSFGIDFDQLKEDFHSDVAADLFRDDMEITQQWGITGFPSFVVKAGGRAEVLVGLQDYEDLLNIIMGISPRALEKRDPPPILDLLDRFRRLATQEIEEIYGDGSREVMEDLETLVTDHHVTELAAGTGWMWQKGRVKDWLGTRFEGEPWTGRLVPLG